MHRKFLTAMVVASALALGACQEDATMDELIEEIELNEETTTGGSGGNNDEDPPGGS